MEVWETIKRVLKESFSSGEEGQEGAELPLATAVLLIEVARSDMEISEPEIKVIRRVIQEHYGKSDVEADQLIQLAIKHAEELICLRDFTKTINASYSEQDKERLIIALWQVAYADGVLDRYEDHWIGRLSEMLYVPRGMVVKHKNLVKGCSE